MLALLLSPLASAQRGAAPTFGLQAPSSCTAQVTNYSSITLGSNLTDGTNHYGTTFGGPGEVFQLTPPTMPGGAWTETVLHCFSVTHNHPVDNPIGLTVAPDGTIYGSAYGYDPPLGSGASAAFQLMPPTVPGGPWTYTLLTTPVTTEHLNTPLVLLNGNLYGGITTGNGGSIFELRPPSSPGGPWTMTTLHTFTDGQIPSGNLIVGASGVISDATAAHPASPRRHGIRDYDEIAPGGTTRLLCSGATCSITMNGLAKNPPTTSYFQHLTQPAASLAARPNRCPC